MTRLTTSEFIKQAKNAHGDKYDYSKVIYKTKKDKPSIAFVGMDFFYTLLECYSKSNNLI